MPEQKQEPEDKKTSENSKNPNTLDQESVFAGGNDPNQSGNPKSQKSDTKSHIEAPQTGLLVVKKLNNPAISTPGQEGNRGSALNRSNLSADLSYDISADEGQFSGNTNQFHQKDLEKIVKHSEYDSKSEEPSDFDDLNISKIATLVEENLNSPEIGAPVQKAGGGSLASSDLNLRKSFDIGSENNGVQFSGSAEENNENFVSNFQLSQKSSEDDLMSEEPSDLDAEQIDQNGKKSVKATSQDNSFISSDSSDSSEPIHLKDEDVLSYQQNRGRGESEHVVPKHVVPSLDIDKIIKENKVSIEGVELILKNNKYRLERFWGYVNDNFVDLKNYIKENRFQEGPFYGLCYKQGRNLKINIHKYIERRSQVSLERDSIPVGSIEITETGKNGVRQKETLKEAKEIAQVFNFIDMLKEGYYKLQKKMSS